MWVALTDGSSLLVKVTVCTATIQQARKPPSTTRAKNGKHDMIPITACVTCYGDRCSMECSQFLGCNFLAGLLLHSNPHSNRPIKTQSQLAVEQQSHTAISLKGKQTSGTVGASIPQLLSNHNSIWHLATCCLSLMSCISRYISPSSNVICFQITTANPHVAAHSAGYTPSRT